MATVVKIPPSNQTLILASERRGEVSSSGKSATAAGAVLQRVTIVASQPDTTVVYLRADYSSSADVVAGGPATYGGRPSTSYSKQPVTDTDDAGSHRTAAGTSPSLSPNTSLVARQQSDTGQRDGFGNALTSSRDTGLSSQLSPVEQYARTQRILAVTPQVQQIDVHA